MPPKDPPSKIKETLSLALPAALYLICTLRYYPGRLNLTISETGRHLLITVPFIAGGVLIVRSLIKKTAGRPPAGITLTRLGLTLGITIEFLWGIYHYLLING